MVLSSNQAQKFYDRFGKKQDAQAFYENVALEDLVTHAIFEKAENIFEFGCGTGRFAELLFKHRLSTSAVYSGIDISQTMISIAEQRLLPYQSRANLARAVGGIQFAHEEQTMDRVVSTYVLDLLSDHDIENVLNEAHRILKPDGKLCLTGLTHGTTILSRFVSTAWGLLFNVSATAVGGCRPISLQSYFNRDIWSLDYHQTIVRFGVASEVVIATPVTPANGEPNQDERR